MLSANLQGKPVNKNNINTPNNMQTTNCNELLTYKHFFPGETGLLKKPKPETNHQKNPNKQPPAIQKIYTNWQTFQRDFAFVCIKQCYSFAMIVFK